MVGPEAVFDVVDIVVVHLHTTNPDEFGGALTQVGSPRSEVVLGPRLVGALDELAGRFLLGVDLARPVPPDAGVGVHLEGFGRLLDGERDQDQSVCSCRSSHNEMLDISLSKCEAFH